MFPGVMNKGTCWGMGQSTRSPIFHSLSYLDNAPEWKSGKACTGPSAPAALSPPWTSSAAKVRFNPPSVASPCQAQDDKVSTEALVYHWDYLRTMENFLLSGT